MVWVAPKSPCPVELLVVGVDGDDPLGPDQPGARDGGVTHPAAADHCDGVVSADPAGVDRRADAGHHSAAQQSGDGGVGGGVDLRALPFVHQRLVGERPDAQRGRQLGAVGQRHLLLGIEGVEAQVRTATLAGAALTTYRAPVQDHEITWLHVRHTLADGFDGACGLMPEQERVLVVDAALAIGQVGVTDAAGLDVDHHLARSRVGDDDIHHLDGLTLLPRNHTAHCLTHESNLSGTHRRADSGVIGESIVERNGSR